MHILGLNIGHNATAALLKDGKIIGCVSEERFARIKNYSGMPYKSISYLFNENNLTINDIDLVVLDAHYGIDKDPNFGKRFLEDYTKKSLKKKILSALGYQFPRAFKEYTQVKTQLTNIRRAKNKTFLKRELSKILKIEENKILMIDHHLAHALSPCFNLSPNGESMVFTLDGEGEGICASVNVFNGRNLKILARSDKSASLGYLYAITTMYLGMKPLEHEFKVMGMAPYAKKDGVEKVYNKFKDLIWIDNSLNFKSKFSMPFADNFLKREMKFVRFDNLCGAVQKLTEDLVCEWIQKAIKRTGIRDIALSGGVFMNVKASQKISEMPEVRSIFVMPSCGDEANAIGCCFYGYDIECRRNNSKFAPKPLKNLYLGPGYDENYLLDLIKKRQLSKRYKITRYKDINKEVAKILAKGQIVARCTGKSEWGARALGNRSILANPKNTDTIRILNETIKDRDFWMPFTPSMLDSETKKYFKNPKNIFAPYMAITFDSTELAREEMPAAMHPYDYTVRPQVVTKEFNEEYYDLIKKFKGLTGIGALLNTSFNLHGEPNVLTPEEAFHTVENSSLKYLAIGNYLFEKRAK